MEKNKIEIRVYKVQMRSQYILRKKHNEVHTWWWWWVVDARGTRFAT